MQKEKWGWKREDIEKASLFIPTGSLISNKEAIDRIMKGTEVSRENAMELLYEIYSRSQFEVQSFGGLLPGDVNIRGAYRFVKRKRGF